MQNTVNSADATLNYSGHLFGAEGDVKDELSSLIEQVKTGDRESFLDDIKVDIGGGLVLKSKIVEKIGGIYPEHDIGDSKGLMLTTLVEEGIFIIIEEKNGKEIIIEISVEKIEGEDNGVKDVVDDTVEESNEILCYSPYEIVVLEEFDKVGEKLIRVFRDTLDEGRNITFGNIKTIIRIVKDFGLIDYEIDVGRGGNTEKMQLGFNEIKRLTENFDIKSYNNLNKLAVFLLSALGDKGEKFGVHTGMTFTQTRTTIAHISFNCDKPKLQSALSAKLDELMKNLKDML